MLTSNELEDAELLLLRQHQKEFFSSEQKLLHENKSLATSHPLSALAPFVDEDDDLVKVGGRLFQSNLPEDVKHPIIISNESHFAILLVRYYHIQCLHGGPQATLYQVRQRFWIINGRKFVRKIISKCTVCIRFSQSTLQPKMGPLPTERITPGRVFQNTGVDFAGPFMIKLKHSSKTLNKMYIAVFVCFSTKAVHLEVVTNLTTEACIAALKRFVARRGVPKAMFSDNGTNFIGARNELIKLKLILSKKQNSLAQFAADCGMEWSMIPPRAPNFGGLWEAAVKSTKLHLKKVVGRIILTYEEFTTLLCQIESVLNSRPLSPMSSDANDLEPLTPGHFLIGSALTSLPEIPTTKPLNAVKRFELVKTLTQHFWNRWQKEYLNNLQAVSKWKKENQQPKVGDLVFLAEDSTPALHWPLARIVELYDGNDNVVRVAKIKTKKSVLIRPLSKLRPFPNEK